LNIKSIKKDFCLLWIYCDSYQVISHCHCGGEDNQTRVLDSEEIDLIISDQRMPEMSGVEFLSQARIRKPAAIRIMLSGYADMNAALDAINEAGIYKFLVKPWDDLELQQTIDKALEWRRMISGTYTQEML